MSINMSLEEIISKNKKSKSGRLIGGFRSDGVSKSGAGKSGGARSFGRFSDRTPAGKWKHDKYQEETRAFRARGGAIGKVVAGASNPNKKVRVNLSNLGPNVVSADLEELFAPYNIDTATVHFNEHGVSLGTGDVYLKRKDALQMFEDFKGVNEILLPGVQDSAPASNGGCFVENELFDTVRASPLAMESLAAARQISGINMRKNAEKRLLCQGSAAAPTPPSEPRDASGKNGKKKRGAKRR
ncbi:hypothetical protein Q1695_013318 [Nippostrongylus brasiliensis]|nr:hypothetical protein Q1695_013318 [Nippostrongylus brasiliensis]